MSLFYQYHVYLYAKKLIMRKKLKTVIDIGCGSSIKLKNLIFPVCSDIFGIDQWPAINYCRSHHSFGSFYIDNLENPQLELNTDFDLVICSDVIEHILNPDNLLSFIQEISRPDTYIIFSTPERDILRGPECNHSPKAEHVREWNSVEFRNYLENRGFEIIDCRLAPPLKFTWSMEYFKLVFRQLVRRRSFKSCQLVTCKKRECIKPSTKEKREG